MANLKQSRLHQSHDVLAIGFVLIWLVATAELVFGVPAEWDLPYWLRALLSAITLTFLTLFYCSYDDGH
jgi:ABC-type antimicrobial peptide transport system permease subunit